jgi:tetratricopeptide (TPR) repeat protein
MPRLIAFLACLGLILSACQAPSAGKPSVAPTAADPLAAADARLFSGDYDGAEAAYLKLIAAGNPVAQAHYALLLDYESRFGEAVVQARAAAAAHPDSVTLGHLTRALDWTEDIAGALDAGSRAVKATPVDPLAHVFYSEALADSAKFPSARAELRAAEKVANDTYAIAEVEREWSNYYRGLGDVLEELNHLQLSIRAQPGFPERQLELARYQYSRPNPAAAQAVLAAIRKQHPGDYGVNVSIGDTAVVYQDVPVAEAAYLAALKVRPNGTAASLGEAELDVSVKRDFKAAHDLLLASLRANPTSLDVYNYLYHLDLLVLKTDPVQELGPAPAGTALSDARKQGLDRVNSFRSALGLPALVESAPLSEAALAHAYFWLFNYGQPAVADVRVHAEDPALPGAIGADSLARAQHFGYPGSRTAEDISHSYLPVAAVDHWVDAVFHRLAIGDPEATTAGYGEAQVGTLSIQVLDLGLAAASTHGPVVYPAPDQGNIPSAFLGNEIPDPAPTARYPTGYPITIEVGSGSTLKVQSAQLVGPDGKAVAGYGVDPAQLQANQYGVLPQDPLAAGSRFTFTVSGTVDGQPFQKSWSFTVAAS